MSLIYSTTTLHLQLIAQMLVWPRHSSLYLLVQHKDSNNKTGKGKLKVGTKVDCRYSGEVIGEDAYFPGVIARANSDGTYDIDYDDGDQEESVDFESIRLPGAAAAAKKSAQKASKESEKQGVATLLSAASNEHMTVRCTAF